MQLSLYFVTRLKKLHNDNTIEPPVALAVDEFEVEEVIRAVTKIVKVWISEFFGKVNNHKMIHGNLGEL